MKVQEKASQVRIWHSKGLALNKILHTALQYLRAIPVLDWHFLTYNTRCVAVASTGVGVAYGGVSLSRFLTFLERQNWRAVVAGVCIPVPDDVGSPRHDGPRITFLGSAWWRRRERECARQREEGRKNEGSARARERGSEDKEKDVYRYICMYVQICIYPSGHARTHRQLNLVCPGDPGDSRRHR